MIIAGNHSNKLELKSIGRELNKEIVKCEVSNTIGKSEDTKELDIRCKSVSQSHSTPPRSPLVNFCPLPPPLQVFCIAE